MDSKALFETLHKGIVVDSPRYIDLLAQFIKFRGISQQVERRGDLLASADWLEAQLRSRGGQVVRHELGPQPGVTTADGAPVPLPPIFTAAFGDASLPTVLAYCHYDVQPAILSDGWHSEPFELTVRDGKMYGRGTTDDKGPIVAWLWALDQLAAAKIDLPVRLVLCFEGMEENGSVKMPDWIARTVAAPDGAPTCPDAAAGLFSSTCPIRPAVTVITDSYWLSPGRPAVTNALRGNVYFTAKVTGPASDLHSGVHGGPVHEPMVDLCHLLSKLVTPAGEILVAGLEDDVRALTPFEHEALQKVAFDPTVYAQSLGLKDSSELRRGGKKEAVLLSRWRRPTLSIHGVEGAFYEPGAKTVIPGTVTGKFSIRTVPDMTVATVTSKVVAHCEAAWATLGSPNKFEVSALKGGPWFYEDPTSAPFVAARATMKTVWGVEPDITAEGGSIPVATAFREAAGTGLVLLPMGAFDDGAHAQNEKFAVEMFEKGAAAAAVFLFEIAKALKA